MKSQERFKAAFERKARALARRPSLGKRTARTTVRLGEGFVCQVEDGPFRFQADFDKASGGEGDGPRPGTYGRAALGTCLAMSYLLWAAKLDVPLSLVEVEVETDFDESPTYGLSDEPPGYKAIRYTVTVESTASEEDIARVLDKAERHSPYFDVFTRPQKLERTVKVLAPR